MGINWTCSYCNRPCTVGDDDVRTITGEEWISNEYGIYRSVTTVVVCPNTCCRKRTISLDLYRCSTGRGAELLFHWALLPESEAKPFPDYIPKQLRSDYAEACLIKNKSPKAAATLSRRCLQGMIRDFWGIKKSRLIDEISELEAKVERSTWKAIDSVRQVGNLGAHMGGDVNLIVDVEPEEADMLIGLIETLFQEWYITRHERETRMTALATLADRKKTEKAS